MEDKDKTYSNLQPAELERMVDNLLEELASEGAQIERTVQPPKQTFIKRILKFLKTKLGNH